MIFRIGLKSLYSTLLNLDIVGPPPELKINKQPRYRTIVGVFFTLLSIGLSILTVKFSISNFIYKTNPDVFLTSEHNEDPIYVNNTNLKFFFTALTLNETTFTLDPIDKK